MDNAYVRSAQDVLKHFHVSEQTGLSEKAIAAARETHGRNCEYESKQVKFL